VGGSYRDWYENWEDEERELRSDMSISFTEEDIERIIKLDKEAWLEWKENKV